MDNSASNINVDQLTTEEKMKLTSGKDFWASEALPDHKIPSIRMSDGPHGLRYQAAAADHLGINDSVPSTSFPTASASAATWDPELIAKMGAAIGLEAQSLGVDVVLGPGVNMKRNILARIHTWPASLVRPGFKACRSKESLPVSNILLQIIRKMVACRQIR